MVTALVKNLQGFIKNFEKRVKGFDVYNALFSSMLTSAEFYLSNNSKVKRTKNKDGSLLKRTKGNLVKLLKKPVEGIERLLDSNASLHEINNGRTIIETSKRNAVKDLKYFSEPKKFSVKKALKNLYMSFVGYAKKGYEATESNSKKAMDTVKLTMAKILKLGEYIMAKACPQWNMPWGSKFDYDALAQSVSPQGAVSEELKKYQIGYNYLRYRE